MKQLKTYGVKIGYYNNTQDWTNAAATTVLARDAEEALRKAKRTCRGNDYVVSVELMDKIEIV